MDRDLYLRVVRRHRRLIVAVPLLIALLAGASALVRPARYGVQMRVLVTRDAAVAGAAGRTAAGEDTTAQDVPAIVQSATFRGDLAQALAQQGHSVDPAALGDAISASTTEHTVAITVAQAQPEQALAIAQALIGLLGSRGLRYWGDPSSSPQRPGLSVGVLDPPAQATRLNGPRSLALEVALRSLAGLGGAIGLAFLSDYARRNADRGEVA
jgi:hypothetical protein